MATGSLNCPAGWTSFTWPSHPSSKKTGVLSQVEQDRQGQDPDQTLRERLRGPTIGLGVPREPRSLFTRMGNVEFWGPFPMTCCQFTPILHPEATDMYYPLPEALAPPLQPGSQG